MSVRFLDHDLPRLFRFVPRLPDLFLAMLLLQQQEPSLEPASLGNLLGRVDLPLFLQVVCRNDTFDGARVLAPEVLLGLDDLFVEFEQPLFEFLVVVGDEHFPKAADADVETDAMQQHKDLIGAAGVGLQQLAQLLVEYPHLIVIAHVEVQRYYVLHVLVLAQHEK